MAARRRCTLPSPTPRARVAAGVLAVLSACRAPTSESTAAENAPGTAPTDTPAPAARVVVHERPDAAPTPARAVLMNQEIVICGRRVPIGVPVVTWTEAPFYDAYSERPRFRAAAAPGADPTSGLRYQPGRVRKAPNPRYAPPPETGPDTRLEFETSPTVDVVAVAPDETDPKVLAEVVDQFVLHFDVCGLSRTCFRVLQDERKLSVHFLLDVDGTIYQTLDLRETAWHATKSNPRSIGIEIANIGAYAPSEAWKLTDWYRRDDAGTYVRIPPRIRETGIRTSGFLGRPARDHLVVGAIQGETLHQYDFTPQQYESLVALTAALCREFPKIRPDAPRDAQGWVETRALSDEAWARFGGVLGHYHVQTNKVDPGPAFDWERFLVDVRARLGRANSGSDPRQRP